MSIRADTALTPHQQGELGRLLGAGAVDRDNAKSIYDLGMKQANPNVVGILIDKGWALKCVKTVSFSSRTLYWLTPEGVAKARELGF